MGDAQGIPTNTPDQFPAQAEGLGGPCGTRGIPTLYGAIWASNLALDHLNPLGDWIEILINSPEIR